ncbi:MAG: translation initiation factor IF-5A [Candidatus Pacearchaeota archaeon]
MVYKLISATEAKEGTNVIIEGAPCTVKRIDISKTGKHGASKVRLEAVGIIDGKKRITVMPGDERLEVPTIIKKRAQVISLMGERASVMDLESFETFDLAIDKELQGTITEGDNVEYWDIDGVKIVKRKI